MRFWEFIPLPTEDRGICLIIDKCIVVALQEEPGSFSNLYTFCSRDHGSIPHIIGYLNTALLALYLCSLIIAVAGGTGIVNNADRTIFKRDGNDCVIYIIVLSIILVDAGIDCIYFFCIRARVAEQIITASISGPCMILSVSSYTFSIPSPAA